MKRFFTLLSLVCAGFYSQAQALHPEMGAMPDAPLQFVATGSIELPTPLPSELVASNSAATVQSGDWFDPLVWDCECIPDGDYDVIVNDGHEIGLSQNVNVINLTVLPGGQLRLEGDDVNLGIEADCGCGGLLVPGTGTVQLKGVAAHQLIGVCDFFDLENTGTGEVTVLGETNIFGALFLGEATLVTNDALYFRSSGLNQSGALAPLTLPNLIEGGITYERFIASSANGWLTLGTPVTDTDLEDLDDNFITTGFPGSDFPTNSFVSVRTYNESAGPTQSSFVAVTNSTEPFVTGAGYYVYANAGSYLFDAIGTPHTGVFTFDVSYTNYDTPLQDGLNVLANPYPADIDWSKEAAWSKDDIHNTLYIWDVSLGRFRTYANGYGINGGSPIIRGGEAFWAHAFSPDATLRVSEPAKSIHETPEVNTGDQFVMLQLTGLGVADEVIVAFDPNTTGNYDMGIDAMKLGSESSASALATRSDDNINMAINHVSLENGAVQVPILVSSTNGGEGVLNIVEVPNLPDRCAYIEDLVSGELYPLESTEGIPFSTPVTTFEPRFILHVTAPVSALASMASCYGATNGEIFVEGAGDGPWNFTIADEDGQTIASAEGVNQPYTFDELPFGDYTVLIDGVSVCSTLSISAKVEEPLQLEAAYDVTHIGCGEDNTGVLNVLAAGGTGQLNYLWSDGTEGADRSELSAGTYSVTVTDENGCSTDLMMVVTEAQDAVSDFAVSTQITNLQNGEAAIYFTNASSNAGSYLWDFGDGSALSTDYHVEHVYTQPGTYVVTLTASNADCSDMHQMIVVIEAALSVNDLVNDGAVVVSSVNGQTVVHFRHDDFRSYRIDAYNLLGQQLITPIEGRFGAQRVNLDLPSYVPIALISIRAIDTNDIITFKVSR